MCLYVIISTFFNDTLLVNTKLRIYKFILIDIVSLLNFLIKLKVRKTSFNVLLLVGKYLK